MSQLLDKIAGRRVVASVSGGKDSAALSLWLTERGIEHDRIFFDTGWEHAATYEYLRGPLTEKLGPITELRGPLGFADLVRKKGMFPYRTIRFCTEELKVFPAIEYLNGLMASGVDVVNAVGIRREESQNRASALEWEWSKGFDCEIWRPLVDWKLQDVIDIHRRHRLRPNPLYLQGAERVGCFPCIHARKEEIAALPDWRVAEIRALETEVVEAALARATANGETLQSPPRFFTLRERGQDKHRFTPIDEVVAWARTARGGKQLLLLDNSPNEACMRWSLCDAAQEPKTP